MDTFLRFHFTIAASEKWSNFASMFFGRIKFHDENLFKSDDYDCDHTKISFSGTVWKFHDFSISQILREIKFGDFRSAKSAIFAILEALYFDFLWIFALLKAEMCQISKIQSSINVQNGSFRTFIFSKINIA